MARTLLFALALSAVPATLAAGDDLGTLVVVSKPPSRIFVDGDDLGTTPIQVDLEPGDHEVHLEHDGRGRTLSKNIERGRRTFVTYHW
jgi:hypothetical protein